MNTTAVHQAPVRRLHVGSPLEVALELPTYAAGFSALAMLMYAAKRAFGIDLEFRTHRALKESEYLEARRLVDEALERSAQGLRPSPDENEADKLRQAGSWIELAPSRPLRAGYWKGEEGAFIDWEAA